ncbi:MAG: hypothetical protein ABJA70_14495, partial [Chryseolinea sp.]
MTLHKKGGIDGQINQFIPCKDISSEITGIYLRNGDNVQVGFMIDHQRPNECRGATSMFTGEILR